MKKILLTALLFIPLFAYSQQEALLDRIYSTEKIDVLDAAYLVFADSGRIDFSADLTTVEGHLKTHSWGRRILKDSVLDLGDLSLLIMNSYPIPKSLFFRITGLARYAVRDLEYQGLIKGKADTKRKLQAFELISVISRARDFLPKEKRYQVPENRKEEAP